VKRDLIICPGKLSGPFATRGFPISSFAVLLLVSAAFAGVLTSPARAQTNSSSPTGNVQSNGEKAPPVPWRDATHEAAGAVAGATPSAGATDATKDIAKEPAKDVLKAANDTPKAGDDVRKDTPAITINPHKGIKMDVDLALINATVTDPYNRLVTGLDPDNFRVFEDNVEQEIVSFSSEDVPISIGVIFDYSGSMANKAAKAREAAIQFFKTANPQDEFFLVSFNERAELTSEFTNSVEDLQSRMMLTSPKGRTALLDAIYLGLSEMRSAHNAKRALLILSDGGDNHSRYNEGDIKRLVKEADTQLYAIGIFDPVGYRNRTLEEGNGPSLLSEVTELTGGRVFPVEKLEDLPDIASKIGMELRNQYVLGYHPSNKTHDARWRKVKIKLRAPRGLPPLTVYNKTGYYAPNH
jgi:Ca-activated chloride channel homolog